MDADNFYKGPPERVLEILRNVFGDYFKEYFNGLVDDLPESLLPCVMASTVDGETGNDSTATDAITETVAIVVAINKKDYIGPQDGINRADLEMRRLVMGQDPNTGQYLPRTIMYALRKYFTLQNSVVDNRISFEFAPGQRGEKIFTQECYLTFVVERQVIVPTRE